MKIVPLIAIIATLGLGVAGWMYSSHQQTTMKLVVGVVGGADGTSGLKAANQALDTTMATASTERKTALEASAQAGIMLQRSAEALAAAEQKLEEEQGKLAEMLEKVEEARAHQAEYQAEMDALLAYFRSLPALSNVSDVSEAVATLAETVSSERERGQALATELEEKVTVREAAARRVAAETAELERLDSANRRFEEEYRKNDDEFSILAVDTRWKFVVISVGRDSGLVAGDTTPLIVKRGDAMIATLRITSVSNGQVIAEYKAEDLPAGVTLEVGDRVFVQKPVGS